MASLRLRPRLRHSVREASQNPRHHETVCQGRGHGQCQEGQERIRRRRPDRRGIGDPIDPCEQEVSY